MDATIKATETELVIRLANGCTISQRRYGPYQLWLPGGTMYAEYSGNHGLKDALRAAVKLNAGVKV
jgi:hypothetical protein